MHENDSLIEIAVELMEKKRKPHSLMAIAKEAFEIKNIKSTDENYRNILAQFTMDFMLSGHFIWCNEDKKGNKLWDLKTRQSHELQDKDIIDDIYADDEDVKKNELKGEIFADDDEEYEGEDDDIDDDGDDLTSEFDDDDDDLIIKNKDTITDEEDEDDVFDDPDKDFV